MRVDIQAARSILRDERRGLARTGSELEILPNVTRTTWDSRWHFVIYSDLNEDNADAEIDAQIAHFRAKGQEFEWKLFGDDQPSDLRLRLLARGFEFGDKEAVVLFDLADGIERFEVESDCEVRRITDPLQIDDFRTVASAVFDKNYDPTSEELRQVLLSRSTSRIGYVGYIDGIPVSVGRLHTDQGSMVGGLYGGGTLAEFRGRGCYRAMIAARARDAVTALAPST